MLRKMFFQRSESKERKIVCSLSQSLLNKTTHDTATPPYIVSTCTQMWARVSGLPLCTQCHMVLGILRVFIAFILLVTLCTSEHHYAYSPYCSPYISLGADKENLLNNHRLLWLVTISIVLMTLMYDTGVISQGKMRCQSLQGLKG